MSGLRILAENATRLHDQDRVLEVKARVFRVLGDDGMETVALFSGDHAVCTCDETGVCEHIGAAMLAMGIVEEGST